MADDKSLSDNQPNSNQNSELNSQNPKKEVPDIPAENPKTEISSEKNKAENKIETSKDNPSDIQKPTEESQEKINTENPIPKPIKEEPKPDNTVKPKEESKAEKKEKKLYEKNTDPDVLELVEDIRKVAQQLGTINKHPDLNPQSSFQTTPETTENLNQIPNSNPESKADNFSNPVDTDSPKESESKTTPLTPEVEKTSFFKKLFAKKNKKTENPINEKPPKKSKKKLIIILFILILIPIIIIAILYFLTKPIYQNGLKTVALAKETVAVLQSQNLPEAESKIKQTKQALQETQKSYSKISFLKILPFLGKYIEDGEAALNAGLAGAEAAEIMLVTINPYADVLGFKGEGSFQGGTTEERIALILETMGQITPNLASVAEKLNVVESEFSKINPADYPQEFKGYQIHNYFAQAQSMLSEAKVVLNDARPMMETLPAIMGYPDTKKYLVIFQNDGELRATGGFMSAYSLIKLEKGKVIPETSNDIYSLDNRFYKVLEPPTFIKEHLNEKRWFLRNMNTSPDFTVSMKNFEENYNTISGAAEINGIIAIDTQVLERIIEIIGPVEVPGYGTFTTEVDERCNLSQVVCELEYIVDKPLATISTNRKADILGPMMSAILNKTFQGDNQQLAKLVPLALKLIEEKHVLAYFNNETFQAAAETFNLAGRIKEFDGDYLHINNSNLGGAKSNFYINEAVDQKIEISDDGTIKKTVEISFTHNEPADNCNLETGDLCLSGIQRNYFRVYVPQGSVLEEGLGSQVKMSIGEDLGKTYFDGFFELRPESKVKVRLVYTLPFKANSHSYQILIQKQPGTNTVTHNININDKVIKEFTIDKDTELNLSF